MRMFWQKKEDKAVFKIEFKLHCGDKIATFYHYDEGRWNHEGCVFDKHTEGDLMDAVMSQFKETAQKIIANQDWKNKPDLKYTAELLEVK